MFTIDCGNIFLREFLIEDVEKNFVLAREKNISKFLPDWKVSKEQRLEWLRDYKIVNNKKFLDAAKQNKIDEHELKLGIILKETNEFIGWCCTIIKEELPQPNREINYAISEKYCNKGYATNAVNGLINYLFNKTNCDNLIAIALLDNVSFNRVIIKSGFKYIKEVKIEEELYKYYTLNKDN